MDEQPISWRVWWQDFDGHRFGTPKAKCEHRDFNTQTEAERFLVSVKCGDCVANIQPQYIKPGKPKAMFDDDQLPRMGKRLTA